MNAAGEDKMRGSRAFAILSDIHANATALEAVLQEVEKRSATWGEPIVVCVNGDTLDGGPEPERTLELLDEWGVEVILMGNHEEYLADCLAHPEKAHYQDRLWRFVPWTVSRVGGTRLTRFLSRCRLSWRHAGSGVRLTHASLEKTSRLPSFFPVQDPTHKAIPQPCRFAAPRPGCFFAGHSHYLGSYRDPVTATPWVNTGSVGYPFVTHDGLEPDETAATFVLARFTGDELQVEFMRTGYRASRLIETYHATGALEECAPFSLAVLAQSLLGEDIVYPCFRDARSRQVAQRDLGPALVSFLTRQGYVTRMENLFRDLGFSPATLHNTLVRESNPR